MKIKNVTFKHTGEFRVPKKNEWICGDDGIYKQGTGNRMYYEYEICRRIETIDEWKPKLGETYYFPQISHQGLPTSSCAYVFSDTYAIDVVKDFTFVFPTYELAMQQAKKWFDDANKKITHTNDTNN
jgi:hypothetical protein